MENNELNLECVLSSIIITIPHTYPTSFMLKLFWIRVSSLGGDVVFLICSSGGPPVWWSKTICAMLKEGIMGNIHPCEVI